MSYDASKGPGRVFFSEDKAERPAWVAYQPLENHRHNVEVLLNHWQVVEDSPAVHDADLTLTRKRRDRLGRALRHHDWGKTARFAIKRESDRWVYSFSGHRYVNPAELRALPFELALERGHHDYSVEEVVQSTFALRRDHEDARDYPRDLFILEMCDQIEAEVAVLAVPGDMNEAEGRNAHFMEFEVRRPAKAAERRLPEGRQVFELSPYPFANEVLLNVDVRRWQPREQVGADSLRQEGFADYESIESIPVLLRPRTAEFRPRVTDACGDFYRRATVLYGPFQPNALQREVWTAWQDPAEPNPGLVVKAPTGVGKTEACALPALAAGRRVVMVLPAKALVDDHKRRFSLMLQALSMDGERRLLVDTGDAVDLMEWRDGQHVERLSGRSRQHLYRADVILTTLDKFLYRFFGYGGGRKSYTYPLRLGDRSRVAFVFDEAHSYEGTSFTNFQRLVNTLYDHEHAVTLMTATLPNGYQSALQDPDGLGYSGRWTVLDFMARADELRASRGEYAGQHVLTHLPDAEPFKPSSVEDAEGRQAAREAFEAHKQGRSAQVLATVHAMAGQYSRLLVTLDRVSDAAVVFQALRAAGLPHPVYLYHGRLDRDWRGKVYAEVKDLDTARSPYILVSTSAIEIGVDLDTQVLVTEICNPDALVQRMGRCNRRGKEPDAQVVVLGSHIPAYLDDFGEEGAPEFEAYLADLMALSGARTNAGLALRLLAHFEKPVLHDPRALIAFDMLYRYVYDFEVEYRPLHDLGFIATRAWDPALDVRIPVGDGWHTVTVPVSRLAHGSDDAADVTLERLTYSADRDRNIPPVWQPVSQGGDLYRSRYRVCIHPDSALAAAYRPELGLVNVPRIFDRQHWHQDPPRKVRLAFPLFEWDVDVDGASYIADRGKVKTVVLSYLAEPLLGEH